jgi:hypothetical protein
MELPLSPEYIASIRAEVNELLDPHGLQADESWRVIVETNSDRRQAISLRLSVPCSADILGSVHAIIEAEDLMNQRHGGFWLFLSASYTRTTPDFAP